MTTMTRQKAIDETAIAIVELMDTKLGDVSSVPDNPHLTEIRLMANIMATLVNVVGASIVQMASGAMDPKAAAVSAAGLFNSQLLDSITDFQEQNIEEGEENEQGAT